jgi:methylaspartate mutase epsilon subunit
VGKVNVANRMLPSKLFSEIRTEVLGQWHTAKDVDLEEAIAYHRQLPKEKLCSHKLKLAKSAGNTLIQPRAGVAEVKEHIELLQHLETEGEADLLPTTIDSYTRHNRYQDAERGLYASRQEGRCLLNGFPAVNHGVAICRRVNEAVNVPVEVRHGTPDARLLAEITLAGGFTSFEGGGISYNIPYTKNIPLEKTIFDWQYVDRLVGLYEEAGVSINREPFGPLTGTLVPACLSHAVAIIESLLAAEQGVKNITVGYGQNGNLVQDVAAIRTLESLTLEYLEKCGYQDVFITTVLHQWMGGFPQDEAKAFAVISWGAALAALSGATKVIVKTPHEALGIPTKGANVAGLKATKQLVTMLKDQSLEDTRALAEEMKIIIQETRSILERVLALGDGDLALGAIRAFKAGVIDIPFAPSRFSAGKVLPARDNNGAVRFLEHGNLPFSADIVAFHKEKMEQRARYEKRSVSFQMVIDDIYAIGKGRLVGRPR